MSRIVVLGVYVADTAFGPCATKDGRKPSWRVLRASVRGKRVEPGRRGKPGRRDVHFVSRLGHDAFAAMARDLWAAAGVRPVITVDPRQLYRRRIHLRRCSVWQQRHHHLPWRCGTDDPADVEASADLIAGAKVAVTQLEQPIAAARRFLEIARDAGRSPILNPAPRQRCR